MIIDSLDAPVPGSSLLPTPAGDVYTDPEIFRLEQQNIFETMWNCVLRVDSLASAGEWKTVTVGRRLSWSARGKPEFRRITTCAVTVACVCTTEQGRAGRYGRLPRWTYLWKATWWLPPI